jgi:diguanylate cyclase (GGDEF)-like protein
MSNDHRGLSTRGTPNAALSIRARLALLALIVLVPLLLDRVRDIETDRGERIKAAHQHTLSLARQGSEGQREIVISARAFLQVTARAHATLAATPESCDRFLADIAVQVPWMKSFSVADRTGHIVCSSNPQAVGLDISDRLYFQKVLRTGSYVLSDYTVGRVNNTPMMVAGFPQQAADGTVEAVMVGVLDSVWIARLASATAERPRAAVLMVDGEGTVLTHHPDPATWAGRQFKDHPLVRPMLSQPEGVVTAAGLDGVRRVFGFVQLPGTDTRLAIGLDESEILGRVNREMLLVYGELGAVAIIVMVLIWFGGDRLIVRPIRLLAKTAERIGRGEYETRASNRRWAAEFMPLVTALDEMAARIAARRAETRAMTDHLNELATKDELSGLANRRAFDRRIESEWQHAMTRERPLALLMIDTDHFKAFNDHYGHLQGDACLRALGGLLAACVQTELDFAARYGGEEFAMLLPGLDVDSATEVAEQLRAAVEMRHLQHVAAPLGRVTVSIGVASLRPVPGTLAHGLIEAADTALYAAKHRGRNTVVAQEVPGPRALAS